MPDIFNAVNPFRPATLARARVKDTSQCALVLEDNPVGADSRLPFSSFPEDGIEQAYNLAPHAELGGNRMPQPAYVTYQGGDWAPFKLDLKFVAGDSLAPQDPNALSPSDIEDILTDVEAKVNWIEAACFPLERANVEAGRILSKLTFGGAFASVVGTEAAANLRRNDPPVVLIVFGSWRIIRGVMTNFRVNWKGPWHPDTVQPSVAEVTVQFKPVMFEYPTWESIRYQHGARGQGLNTTPGVRGTVNIQAAQAADAQRATALQRFQDNTSALRTIGVNGVR